MNRLLLVSVALCMTFQVRVSAESRKPDQQAVADDVPVAPTTFYSESVKRLDDAGVRVHIAGRPRTLQSYVKAGRGVKPDAVSWLLEVDWKSDPRIPMPDLSKKGPILVRHLTDMRTVQDVILSQMAITAEDSNIAQMIGWTRCAVGVHFHLSQRPSMVEGKSAATLLEAVCRIINESKILSKVDSNQRKELQQLAVSLKKQHIECARNSLIGERDFVVAIIDIGNTEPIPLDEATWRTILSNKDKTTEAVKNVYDKAVASISAESILPGPAQDALKGAPRTARHFTSYVPDYLEFLALRLDEVKGLEEATK